MQVHINLKLMRNIIVHHRSVTVAVSFSLDNYFCSDAKTIVSWASLFIILPFISILELRIHSQKVILSK